MIALKKENEYSFYKTFNRRRRFNDEFFSSGYKVIHIPTLSISSANMQSLNTKDYDALIFTSANAVRFLKLKNKIKV